LDSELIGDKPSARGYHLGSFSGSTIHLSAVEGKRLAVRRLVVVRLSLDSRLGHLAMSLSVLAVVVELVLGLVEERSDEVEDAVISHVRPKKLLL
jgi:hypothetical protein